MKNEKRFSIIVVIVAVISILFYAYTYVYAKDPNLDRWNRATEKEIAIKQAIRLVNENSPEGKTVSLEKRVKILEQKILVLERMPAIRRYYRKLESLKRHNERKKIRR